MIPAAMVLTWHAVEHGRLPAEVLEDPFARRYLVDAERFESMLDLIPAGRCRTAAELGAMPAEEWLCLTFDDGLGSDWEVAFPRLLQRGLRATFFVTAENIGRQGYCTAEELRAMAKGGMEIGSHGVTHRPLTILSRQEAGREIRASKEGIEQLLGAPVTSYAPVGGHFRAWMVSEAKRAGYSVFAAMLPGRTRLRGRIPLVLRRNHVQACHDDGYVRRLVAGEVWLLLANRIRYAALKAPKRALGLRNYDRLKRLILGCSGVGKAREQR